EADQEAEGRSDQPDDQLGVARLRGLGRRQGGEHAQDDDEAVPEPEPDQGAQPAAQKSRSLQSRYQVLPPAGSLLIAYAPPAGDPLLSSAGEPVEAPVEVPGTGFTCGCFLSHVS